MRTNRIAQTALLLILVQIGSACGFAEHQTGYAHDAPGFFHGIWHGLLAPWTLLIRGFIEMQMYAMPNSGWFYDAGFLVGILGSLPIGWLAAIIQVVLVLS
jgi:hypothetical protein